MSAVIMAMKVSRLALVGVLVLLSVGCNHGEVPVEKPERTPVPLPQEKAVSPEVTPQTADESSNFDEWWQNYRKPFDLDTPSCPVFYCGAWTSRLDEARSYLLNTERLRETGSDTVLLGVDVIFDPETGDARSLGDNVFIFYFQALKRAGFRVLLILNPMHPNLDMGEGYEWEGPDPNARYHRSYELIKKLDPVVVKWAEIAQEYHADGFAPVNEPYKLV